MNKLVSDKLQDIAQLCQMYSVKSMYLFGSAGNEEFFNVDSDIDFLIAFKEISVEELLNAKINFAKAMTINNQQKDSLKIFKEIIDNLEK